MIMVGTMYIVNTSLKGHEEHRGAAENTRFSQWLLCVYFLCPPW